MLGILIVFHRGVDSPRALANAAQKLGRVLNIEIRIQSFRRLSSVGSFQRGQADALSRATRGNSDVVISYRGGGASAAPLRAAARRLIPGARPKSLLIAPFLVQTDVSPRQRASNYQPQEGGDVSVSAVELRELLSAALANSHACQNWLAEPSPNFDRARASISNVTRDLGLVADLV